jgi:hypothetical protein
MLVKQTKGMKDERMKERPNEERKTIAASGIGGRTIHPRHKNADPRW